MSSDTISTAKDDLAGEPLLLPAMIRGQRTAPPATLGELRARAQGNLGKLPPELRRLDPATAYPVAIGDALRRVAEETDRRINLHESAM
jgi:nicotinate phosphoribosyltransferase